MKTPEESNYPTGTKVLEASKKYIEESIDEGKFTIPSDKITSSSDLKMWLANFGWGLKYIDGDFREREPGYYNLFPLRKDNATSYHDK